MDFDKRLERAIERGRHVRSQKTREQVERELNEEELRNLHSQYRLELSERIETCLRQLADHFPGFQFQSVFDETGWGASISRDDFRSGRDKRSGNYFSRLKVVVTPHSDAHIVSVTVKGTIRNREVINRSHFQYLEQVDVDSFAELIDLWVLEFAEQYAAEQ